MNTYLWTKTFHLLFVIAWMATVFCLPRLLLELAKTAEEPAVRDRLIPLGLGIYRFGHHLFGLAFGLGLVLWLHFGIAGPWLHVKLVMVALMLALFTLCGRWLKRAAAGRALPSVRVLQGANVLPSLLLLAIIWLAIAKPL